MKAGSYEKNTVEDVYSNDAEDNTEEAVPCSDEDRDN